MKPYDPRHPMTVRDDVPLGENWCHPPRSIWQRWIDRRAARKGGPRR